jgi:uncharacterized phage protein (TIGR01671 family)
MREIKFRGIERGFSKFVYGTGLYQDTHNTWIILENPNKKPFSQIDATIIDPETVGQFIGRVDEIGTEIYEGDNVTWYVNGIETTATVYYDIEQATFWMGEDKVSGCGLVLNDWYRGEYRVIGNIYQKESVNT